jgi:hypothetical protein
MSRLKEELVGEVEEAIALTRRAPFPPTEALQSNVVA